MVVNRLRRGWRTRGGGRAWRARGGGIIAGAVGGLLALAGAVAPVRAASGPREWQINLTPAAGPLMEDIHAFHNFLLVVIVAISVFVTALLAICFVRFNARANPTPTGVSHNTRLEIIWTLVPVLILAIIAAPSFRILRDQAIIPEADFTIKVIGHQWFWTYEYPDHGEFVFDSLLIPEEDLKPDQPRLLAVDNPVVAPVGATVRVVITASDVLHAWTVPAVGVKADAIPGRLHETWFRADREGTYYGQCSELCGTGHAFMPIELRIVAPDAFEAWTRRAKREFADDASPRRDPAPRARAAAPGVSPGVSLSSVR